MYYVDTVEAAGGGRVDESKRLYTHFLLLLLQLQYYY